MVNMSSHVIEGKRPVEGASAIAADIRKGKRAYGAGTVLRGTAELKPLNGVDNGLLLLMQNPTGVPTATYNPVTAGSVIAVSDRILDLTSSGNWELDTNGYAYGSSAYTLLVAATKGPRLNAGARKYEMWGKTKDAAPTNEYGVRTYINRNPINGDAFYIQLSYSSGSSVLLFTIREWASSVETIRATVTLSSTIGVPTLWHSIVYEQGNTIIAQLFTYENDYVTDDGGNSIEYTVANRPHKENAGFGFGNASTSGDQFLIRGCSIMDLSNG